MSAEEYLMTQRFKGPQIGPYEILCLIGQGAFGRVVRARETGEQGGAGRLVALKLPKKEVQQNAEAMESLMREARVAAVMEHANVVRTYTFQKIDGMYILAMEYVDGWTLGTLVDAVLRGRLTLPLSVVIEIMFGVADALEYIHDMRDEDGSHLAMVHRDLKPDNIMLGRNGRKLKVMDLGLAKALNVGQEHLTQVDQTRGTPVFMPPEQWTGNPVPVSDVWALGAILYSLVTGEMLFGRGVEPGAGPVPVGMQVMTGSKGIVTAALGQIPEQLRDVFLGCMRFEAENRWTAAAVRRALEAIRVGGPKLRDWVPTVAPRLPQGKNDGDFGDFEVDKVFVLTPTADVYEGMRRRGRGQNADPGNVAGALDGQSPEVELDSLALIFLPDDVPASPSPEVAAGSAEADALTRAMPATPKKRRKVQTRKSKGPLVALVVVAATLLLGVLLWVALGNPPEKVVEPTTPRTEVVAVPDLVPEPTPWPVKVETPTPREVREPTPWVAPQPTPEPTPEPIAEVAPPAMGVLFANSTGGWSNVTIPGFGTEASPRTVEVPAGIITVTFQSDSCGGRTATEKVTVAAGSQKSKTIHAWPPCSQ